jgi:hypothetical protein
VIVHRIRSRSINIFFKKPSVAPTNEEEEENFSELQSLISSGESSKCRICSVLVSSDEMSAMLGWEIRLGKLLSSKEGRKEVKDLKESLRGTFAGRSQANWAILFFLVKKLLEHTGSHLCVSLNDVLETANTHSAPTVYQPTAISGDIVLNRLREVVAFSRTKPTREV